MPLARLYAYAVSPQRTTHGPNPLGGELDSSAPLEAALEAAAASVRDRNWTSVAFRASEAGGGARGNPVRALILALAFGDDAAARDAAFDLSQRLASAMDQRARAHLLVIFTEDLPDDHRRVMAWAFPRDDAFRFNITTRPEIELLEDVFSRTSGLRKAANFQGADGPTQFLTGRVLDLQAGRSTTDVADYWMQLFLDCDLEATPVVAADVIGETFRRAFDTAPNPDAQMQVGVAALALQQSPTPTWSIREIGETFLPENLQEHFVASVPRPQSADARMRFDRERLRGLLASRVMTLDTGVVVTAPIEQIDQSVQIDGRHLICEGEIVGDRFRAGRVR